MKNTFLKQSFLSFLKTTVYEKRKIRGLMMAPALFALVAGISPMAQAQDEQSGLSAPIEGARFGDTQRGLASPIEGSWVFAIDVTGPGYFQFSNLIRGGWGRCNDCFGASGIAILRKLEAVGVESLQRSLLCVHIGFYRQRRGAV